MNVSINEKTTSCSRRKGAYRHGVNKHTHHSCRLCRKHNINPASFTQWSDIFFECGKAGIKKPYNRNESKKHDHEMDKLKRIIGDLTIANDALKKTLE